jgi:hypothetical protein
VYGIHCYAGIIFEGYRDLLKTFDIGLQRMLDGLEFYVQAREAGRCEGSDG